MATISDDPKGYYALLGLAPGADAPTVKAAYRRLAKNLHPDHNSSARAAEEFGKISEAYAALKDGPRPYAEAAEGGFAPDDDEAPDPPRPYACGGCGRVTAQPRYVAFHRVKSFLLWAATAREVGIFCRDCADHAAARASTATWVLGWWSLPGLLLSPVALMRNLLGGTMPAAENARLLVRQGRAFLEMGELDIARSLAEQAAHFARSPAQRARVANLLEATAASTRRLKSRWTLGGNAFLAQALPLAALPAVAALFWVIAMAPWREPQLATIAEIAVPAEIGEIRHVAVEELKLRQAGAEGAPVLTILERFATVEVIDGAGDQAWLKVRTPAGVEGFVSAHALYSGSGERLKREWCAENSGRRPEAGEALMRRATGENRLLVHNDGRTDAVLKLKTLSGYTVASFYVPATYHIGLAGIPDGTYRMEFATGRAYSRACGTFGDEVRTAVLPYTLTFKPISAGKARALGTIAEISLVPAATDPNKPQALAAERFAADE